MTLTSVTFSIVALVLLAWISPVQATSVTFALTLNPIATQAASNDPPYHVSNTIYPPGVGDFGFAMMRRNGAPAKALAEKLAWMAEHETNPWVILKAAEFLRDTLDGKLRPVEPEAKDPRRLARIILTNGPAPAPVQVPPAADAARPESPGWHVENGETFVSVPPPGE